jgi:hypothetical protein
MNSETRRDGEPGPGPGPLPLVDDFPPFFGSEGKKETGDSTAAAIIRQMPREEREKAIGGDEDLRGWFDALLSLIPDTRAQKDLLLNTTLEQSRVDNCVTDHYVQRESLIVR